MIAGGFTKPLEGTELWPFIHDWAIFNNSKRQPV